MLAVDLGAVVEGTKLAVRAMASQQQGGAHGGVVVNVASAGGLFPMAFSPVYAAAKAGVVMLCRSLEHLGSADAARPVTVKAFCPQFVDTAFLRDSVAELQTLTAAQDGGGSGAGSGGGGGAWDGPALLAATGGLLGVAEAAAACVEGLVDPHFRAASAAITACTATADARKESGSKDGGRCDDCGAALLLTTSGPRWWRFEGQRRSRL